MCRFNGSFLFLPLCCLSPLMLFVLSSGTLDSPTAGDGNGHAQDALEHITKKGYGLMYMSVLGEEGIVELLEAMREAGAQITNAAIKQKVLGALKRLEDAQPKK